MKIVLWDDSYSINKLEVSNEKLFIIYKDNVPLNCRKW